MSLTFCDYGITVEKYYIFTTWIEYTVVKVSPGGSYGVLALRSQGKLKSFCKFLEVFKICFYHLLVFKCPHHLTLSASLKLHSFLSKTTIHRSLPPPKIFGKKDKSNHQGDSNETPIIQTQSSSTARQNFEGSKYDKPSYIEEHTSVVLTLGSFCVFRCRCCK